MSAYLGSTPTNVLNVLFRSKKAAALYRGSTLLQSFGESSPKLQADFTTGTYKASGANKTFADLFTFNRAGKAWLVKDTGLQEYAVDVPRLDNGLLIEQSATNSWIYSTDFSGVLMGTAVTIKSSEVTGGYAARLPQVEVNAFVRRSLEIKTNLTTLSFYVDNQLDSTVRTRFTIGGKAIIPIVYTPLKGLQYISDSATGTSDFSGFQVYYPAVEDITKYLDMHMAQLEDGAIKTSMIKTASTPVTRPADYLLNNITGTTITGDWDSTLTLSIVAGKLVHSGYGRIRSLEIN